MEKVTTNILNLDSKGATSDTGIATTLNEPEKVDRPEEPFINALYDTSNPVRKEIIQTICKGVYSCRSYETSDPCMDGLLHICHKDRALRSRVLQTPFLSKETPVRLIMISLADDLVNIDSFDDPPLVVASLIAACNPFQNSIAMRDYVRTCCERGGNALYQLINEHRRSLQFSMPYSMIVIDVPRSKNFQGQCSRASFSIPDCPERMLIDGSIDLRFIARESLWSLRFETAGINSWVVQMSLIEDHPSGGDSPLEADLVFNSDGKESSRYTITVPEKTKVLDKARRPVSYFTKPGASYLNFSKIRTFIKSDRVLKGFLEIGNYQRKPQPWGEL